MHEVEIYGDDSILHADLEGQTHSVEIRPWLGTTHFRVRVDGAPYLVVVRRHEEAVLVTVGEEQYRLQVERKLPIGRKTSRSTSRIGRQEVKAPMPGLIVSVQAAPGDRIEQGRPVVIMEAMKMQMEIRAPTGGRVASVHVQPGQEVAGGTVLVSLEHS